MTATTRPARQATPAHAAQGSDLSDQSRARSPSEARRLRSPARSSRDASGCASAAAAATSTRSSHRSITGTSSRSSRGAPSGGLSCALAARKCSRGVDQPTRAARRRRGKDGHVWLITSKFFHKKTNACMKY